MWTAQHLDNSADLAPCGIVLFSDDGRLLALNEPLIQMLGIDREALPRMGIDHLLAPAARVILQMVLMPMLKLHGRANEMALTLRPAQGEDIHVLANSVRREHGTGMVNHCVFLPVDQRKKMEEQLMQRWRATEEIPAVVFQLEVDANKRGRFSHIGEAIGRMTGLSAASVQALREDAQPLFDLIHAEDLARMDAMMQPTDHAPAPGRFSFRLSHAQEGRLTWWEVHATPRQRPGGTVLWNGYMADITRQRAIEDKLRENDKLRVTAMLAAGIAHDFNNLLGSITGLTELCLLAAEDGSRQQRNLGNILTSANKASVLVRQMLDYARQTPMNAEPVVLTELVSRLQPLLQVGLPAGVTLAVQRHSDATVLADAVQLEQVLLNLVNNAGYAMRERPGTITVAIDRPEGTANPLRRSALRMRVADQGCGIAPQDLALVFQPFFTTKPVGAGTGLGLSAAHGIVKEHRGHIDVASEPGVGTTFTIWLPVHEAAGNTDTLSANMGQTA